MMMMMMVYDYGDVDEYDTDSICKQSLENKRVMIRAASPGSGKSYICEHVEQLKYNVLFVVPTNVLVQKYNTSCTLNSFFGFGINDEQTMTKFDSSPYDINSKGVDIDNEVADIAAFISHHRC